MATQETALTKANGAAVTQHGFGTTEVTSYSETAARAVAAREQAAVQARYVMAMQRPRNLKDFRAHILDECERPEFAAVARYAKPIGGTKIYGPSIRFVEAALRAFRNVAPEVMTVFESQEMRVVRVTITDLEANITYSNEIQVDKTVERRGYEGKPPKGRDVISVRKNTNGDDTYLVWATEDEVNIKQAALVSKAIRTMGLRLLPGDVVEECMTRVVQVQNDQDARDPGAFLKAMMDGFRAFGVMPSDLEMWAGKNLERLTPDEKQELKAIFSGIKTGETTWEEVMAEKNPAGTQEAADDVAKKRIAELSKMSAASEAQSAEAPAETTEQKPEEGQAPKQTAFNMGRAKK